MTVDEAAVLAVVCTRLVEYPRTVLSAILAKVTHVKSELLRFGVVGLCGYIVDVGLFNLLRYAGEPGPLQDQPLTAKTLSVSVAIVVTYLGNRHWTWRERPRDKVHREISLFVFCNLGGMAIGVGCLGFSHYILGFTSPLADNIAANVVGLFLGTAFRFWTYRTLVFRGPGKGSDNDRGDIAYAPR